MTYNETLAQRIRDTLSNTKKVIEKKMFGGLAFLIDNKMCVGVWKDDCIVRCDPALTQELLSKKGARIFDITGKPMRGWLLISPEGTQHKKELNHWVSIALAFNKLAKSSKTKA